MSPSSRPISPISWRVASSRHRRPSMPRKRSKKRCGRCCLSTASASSMISSGGRPPAAAPAHAASWSAASSGDAAVQSTPVSARTSALHDCASGPSPLAMATSRPFARARSAQVCRSGLADARVAETRSLMPASLSPDRRSTQVRLPMKSGSSGISLGARGGSTGISGRCVRTASCIAAWISSSCHGPIPSLPIKAAMLRAAPARCAADSSIPAAVRRGRAKRVARAQPAPTSGHARRHGRWSCS